MKSENTAKTYFELKEYLNTGYPVSAQIPNPEFASDLSVPGNLDRINAYIGEIRDGQSLNPYYTLNNLWKKLQIIGINFDLQSIRLTGNFGSVTVPVTQYGGRYGFLDNSGYVKSDDGISEKIPGGISLSIYWQVIRGIYTLDAILAPNNPPIFSDI